MKFSFGAFLVGFIVGWVSAIAVCYLINGGPIR